MWGLDVDGWWECEGKGNEETQSGRRTKREEKKVCLSPPSLKSRGFQGRRRNNRTFKCSFFFFPRLFREIGHEEQIHSLRRLVNSFSPSSLHFPHLPRFPAVDKSDRSPYFFLSRSHPGRPPTRSNASPSQPPSPLCRAGSCHFVSAKYHWD